MGQKLWMLIGLVAALVLPFTLGDEWSWLLFMLNRALIFGIAAIGLNLLTGYAGQISIGHAAFMAVGAFASHGFNEFWGLPFWTAMPLAGLVAGITGLLLGFPALRLHGHYLAIATLGFGVAIPEILNLFEGLTGGWTGIKPVAPYLLGISFRQDRPYYVLILVVLILLAWMARNIVRSRTGRAFVALRDSEVAAQAMGISLPRYKTTAFALSAFYAGIAGSLYAHMINFAAPQDFNLGISMELFTAITLGGLASIPGSIIGALFMSLMPKLTERVAVLLERSAVFGDWVFIENMFKNLNQVLTGIILILVVLYLPLGLVDLWRRWKTRFARKSAVGEGAAKGV